MRRLSLALICGLLVSIGCTNDDVDPEQFDARELRSCLIEARGQSGDVRCAPDGEDLTVLSAEPCADGRIIAYGADWWVILPADDRREVPDSGGSGTIPEADRDGCRPDGGDEGEILITE
jgi:hypothetical protein